MRNFVPRPLDDVPGSAGTDGTVWVDDPARPLPADHGTVAPDGLTYKYTLAAMLDDEAAQHEDYDSDFNRVVARAIRVVARDARALGTVTAGDYLRKSNRP